MYGHFATQPSEPAGRGTYPVAEADRYLRHFGSVEDLMALSLNTECEIITPQLYTDGAGIPVELAVSYFDPAHYSYRVRLRRGPS